MLDTLGLRARNLPVQMRRSAKWPTWSSPAPVFAESIYDACYPETFEADRPPLFGRVLRRGAPVADVDVRISWNDGAEWPLGGDREDPPIAMPAGGAKSPPGSGPRRWSVTRDGDRLTVLVGTDPRGVFMLCEPPYGHDLTIAVSKAGESATQVIPEGGGSARSRAILAAHPKENRGMKPTMTPLALAVGIALITGLNPARLNGQAPGRDRPTDTTGVADTVFSLDPILVRVLRSPVGSGSPYAVAVAAGAELTRSNAGAYLEEALRAAPGVQVHNRFNMAVGERLAVRGHGPRAQFGIRGVRVLVDGVPATLPDGQSTIDHPRPRRAHARRNT